MNASELTAEMYSICRDIEIHCQGGNGNPKEHAEEGKKLRERLKSVLFRAEKLGFK